MIRHRPSGHIWHLIALVIALLSIRAVATPVDPDFTETVVASGLASPTAMAFAPDGRLFVCQQGGALRVIEDGVLLPTPFTTVTVSAAGERGLLGVAFDPNFATNHFVYVYYTATTPAIHNRVSRFTANGNVAVAGSEVHLLDLNNLSSATNHNGGAMHFGSLDDKLYVAVGDNANGANAQTLNNLLGKMLRINTDGTIPTDNPFFGQASGVNRAIWALGLRNPFTFSIHPVTGRMFINDVGQNTWEEINEGLAGANYGWPSTEGYTTNPAFKSPLYAYHHTSGDVVGCAITGGTFYSSVPAPYPDEYDDDYFFADFCGDWINKLDEVGGIDITTFASAVTAPVDLTIGPEGSLYYLARGSGSDTGTVGRIDFSGAQAPVITQQPANQNVSVGQPATFTVAASGTPPLSYQWQRNGVNISGATSASYTLPAAAQSDSGAQFRCVVTNPVGSVFSNSAVLTVTGNLAPTPTIGTPVVGTLYTAGTTLAYSGTASDPEDGDLAASRFTWKIDFHHKDGLEHTHPGLPPTTGAKSGTYAIPNSGETSANVCYRVYLTVVDSGGQQVTVSRDVLPRTAQVTLSTSPSGFQLTLDGAPVTAPYTFVGVAGILRSIGAPSPQTRTSGTYEFRSWSDQGAQTHTIVTPAANTTISATYRKGKGR